MPTLSKKRKAAMAKFDTSKAYGLSGPALHAPWKASDIEWAAAGLAPGRDYPQPLVLHDEARQTTLARYAAVKKTIRD